MSSVSFLLLPFLPQCVSTRMWARQWYKMIPVWKTTQFSPLCRENTRSPAPICLFYFHTGHFTFDTYGHQRCVLFFFFLFFAALWKTYLMRDQTSCTPAVEAWSFNPWTTKVVPKCVCVLSPHQIILQHQLAALQFNPILTLSTWR